MKNEAMKKEWRMENEAMIGVDYGVASTQLG